MASEIQTGIHVSIRARPLNKEELENEEQVVVHPGIAQGSLSLECDPRTRRSDFLAAKHVTAKNYQVDSFFGPEDDTHYIYDFTASNLVPRLLEGFNCSVFCYGPTGTGKTFTMFGGDDQPGMVRHVLEDLINASRPGYPNKEISLSVLEVYGNDINDLLDSSRRDPSRGPSFNYERTLDVSTDCNGETCILGLSKHIIYHLDQALELIETARLHRVTHSTNANSQSSRSHCIIQLKLELRADNFDSIVSKMNLIDLAGSERVHQTGLVAGARMQEACSINYSLLALKKCISGLAKGKAFIPFRDSKLTRILQDCLEGSCLTYLIACVSPSACQWQATRDTLEYGTQARAIKLTAKRQYRPARSLKAQVKFLEDQNRSLIAKVREFEKEQSHGEILRKKLASEFRLKQLAMQQEMDRSLREQQEQQERTLKERERRMLHEIKVLEQKTLMRAMQVVDIDEEKQKILEYEEELRIKTNGMQCVICIDRIATHAFLPCGHRCICKNCSVDVKNKYHQGRKCPICKTKAKGMRQIYL